ncbi:carbon storage regulator [Pseudomonas serbica]|jgi:sRNA-binding carbon storage regulator CsrA|uniref:carbon storage regulator n=1 Tax=Pseudomonas serbica TaxID=2965074 RepID=UPI00237BA8FD|nr:carbon storage regulator [Pseudomonas serbica]
MINSQSKAEGTGARVGLVLSRKTGQNIWIGANADATDEEIIAVMRGPGVFIKLVEITSMGRRFHNAPVYPDHKSPAPEVAHEDTSGMVAIHDGSKGSAKLGINAPKAICILREEIIPGNVPEIARAYGG